jgi:hypothetical protein
MQGPDASTPKLVQHPRPSDAFYWTAPVAADGDFSPEDPLALDYIGQQVGNVLLPTLTTRTTRAQSYAVVLFGLHLAEQVRAELGLPADDSARGDLFERWERFWCLAVLESRGGPLPRGDRDAMRGIQGATKAWFAGDAPLPLDFALISRQSELGSLGAYLSSLRLLGLVTPGTLRPTTCATEILAAFWDEPDAKANIGAFEEYARLALEPDRKSLPRRLAKVTLRGVGERTRLSCLVARQRKEQQARLDHAILGRDDTAAVVKLIEQAIKRGIRDPQTFFFGAAATKYGPVGDELAERLRLAGAFSTAAKRWLDGFNGVYNEAWKADGFAARASVEARLAKELPDIAEASRRLLAEPGIIHLKALPVHGRGFLDLVACGATESAAAVLDHLLSFHARVQHDRRGARGWLALEGDRVVVELSSYNGHRGEAAFPSLKFEVVRSLLRDVGRLA